MTTWYETLKRGFETYKKDSERWGHGTPPVEVYLSDSIFDFTTYDGEMDVLLCNSAIVVCEAITNRKTFDFIANKNNYLVYITMVNMPFFVGKLSWGSSVRGAWWDFDGTFVLDSCYLWDENGKQAYLNYKFKSKEDWDEFIVAVVQLYKDEVGK